MPKASRKLSVVACLIVGLVDQALRAGLGRFKQAVVPIKTQTPNAKLAKKVLLKAIREFDLGLVQYQVLLEMGPRRRRARGRQA